MGLDPVVSSQLSRVVLFAAAGVVVYVGVADLRSYRIRNEVVVLLAGLFFVHAVLSGRWILLPWNIGLSIVMFIILLIAYSRGIMGGGDVKLLTVAFLWTGTDCALVFAIGLLIFSVVHLLLGKLGILRLPQKNGSLRMAYGPSIAGALVLTFALGCLANLP